MSLIIGSYISLSPQGANKLACPKAPFWELSEQLSKKSSILEAKILPRNLRLIFGLSLNQPHSSKCNH